MQLALLLLALVPASSRQLSHPSASTQLSEGMPPLLSHKLQRLMDSAQQLKQKFAPTRAPEESVQPAFAGYWRTSRVENIDEFLDRAMGVSYLKRKVAAKASQSQRLYQRGTVVHLEITDRRGTMKYELYPDGRTVSAKGFMKLPIRQTSRWGPGGSLLTEEQYSQCLGDDVKNPVVRSTRSVTKMGEMLVELERTLGCGETVSMRTWYCRLPDRRTSS